jgi:DNA-binding HxlR family transcriptional regulator
LPHPADIATTELGRLPISSAEYPCTSISAESAIEVGPQHAEGDLLEAREPYLCRTALLIRSESNIKPMVYRVKYLRCKVESDATSEMKESEPIRDLPEALIETRSLRELFSSRGTIEVMLSLCCQTQGIRFTELHRTIREISTRTLATRLKQLEKNGIVVRRSYNEIPPRVEYKLTGKGQEIVGAILSLTRWMRKWSRVSS